MRVPVVVFGWVEVPETEDEGEVGRTCGQALRQLGAELDVVGWEIIQDDVI